MATRLVRQLIALQCIARREGYDEAFHWLGREIARLLVAEKVPSRRKRGIWVTLAATGRRVLLDADLVAQAERREQEDHDQT